MLDFCGPNKPRFLLPKLYPITPNVPKKSKKQPAKKQSIKKSISKKVTKKKSVKSKAKRSKKTPPTYMREIQVRYKKKRVSGSSSADQPLTNSSLVAELFRDMQNETKEKLVAVSLDIKLKIIAFEVVAIGSVAAIYVRPAESLRAPIMLNAYGLILVHNHPSGDPRPSDDDQEFTAKLKRNCDDLGIAFHDHIIIGDDTYFSFADEGMIEGTK